MIEAGPPMVASSARPTNRRGPGPRPGGRDHRPGNAAGRLPAWLGCVVGALGVVGISAARAAPPVVDPGLGAAAVRVREFVCPRGHPTPSCHASTIVEAAGGGLVAAWFGGTDEGEADVGIWLSRLGPLGWSAPEEVIDGVQPDGTRHPCWNPVLFQSPGGPLLLYAKVGPSPRDWWGVVRESSDGGRTWGALRRLGNGIIGPVKNKPLALGAGVVIAGSSSEDDGWKVHFERSTDGGRTFTRGAPVNDGRMVMAIQPSLLVLGGDRLLAVGRTRSGKLFEVESADAGLTWQPLALGRAPNPNAGTDAVTLADGRHLLVSNPVEQGRTPLMVAESRDGRTWRDVVALETFPGEYSYPAIIQAADGRVHVTYTFLREAIVHVVIDPAALAPR